MAETQNVSKILNRNEKEKKMKEEKKKRDDEREILRNFYINVT